MKKIKNILKYYSDMIASINKHTHSTSIKLTKLINITENGKVKSEELLAQLSKNVIKNEEIIERLSKNSIKNNLSNPSILIISTEMIENINLKGFDISYSPNYYESDFDFYLFLNDKESSFTIPKDDTILYFPANNQESAFFSKGKNYQRKNVMNIKEKGNFVVPKNKLMPFLNGEYEFMCGENSKFNDIKFDKSISFIIPVYNVEDFVEETIESILKQKNLDSKNFEILLIDDCSTDKSFQIISKYKKFENIKVYRNNKNSGLGATRNRGLELATKEWISFVDSDDFLNENLYTDFCKISPTAESAHVVMFKLCLFDGENIKWHLGNEKLKRAYNNTLLNPEDRSLPIYDTSACTKFFKKEILKDLSFPNTSYEDGIFASFLADKEILVLNSPGYYYRKMNQVSITSTRSNTLFEKFSSVIDMTNNNIALMEQNNTDENYIKEYLEFSLKKRILLIEKWLFEYCKSEDKIKYENFYRIQKLSVNLSKYKLDNKYELFENVNNYDEYKILISSIENNEILFDEIFYTIIEGRKVPIPLNKLYVKQRGYIKFKFYGKFEVLNLQLVDEGIYKYKSGQAILLIQNSKGKYEKKCINI